MKTLALAYYFTENENHADRPAKLLRAWFLDAETKMNPHLRHAQAIPGRNHGLTEGIIETRNLPELIDAAAVLEGSNSWTRKDRLQLQDW